MTNILTATEASNVLRCEATDADMLSLLPMVDEYIRNATGHDWTADASIHPTAKSAARMLLVLWFENPGMAASGEATLHFGLTACLVQLEAIAMRYRQFHGRVGSGAIELIGARAGNTVGSVTGLIGASGDQAVSFENVISIDNEIQQISEDDLSANWYRVYLQPLEDL